MHETSMQPQSSSESESIMDKEDDVKVCDICGDAGQEDLLAICSRCIDGAEHVYCMRTMMDKLPAGDWLCEDCKLKEEYESRKAHKYPTIKLKDEYENGKAHKYPTIIKIQEESCLNEDAQNAKSVVCSEIILKKEEGAINLEDMAVSRRPQISELYDENLDPFNNPEILTNKTSNSEQFSASCSIFEGQKAHNSLGSISSAGRDSSYVASGPPLKSSFCKTTIGKPKVKQPLGAAPSVKNATGKLIGQMIKPASFQNVKEGCNSFELDNKKPSVMAALGDNRENSSKISAHLFSSALNLDYQTQCQFPEDFQPHASVANNFCKPDPFSQCDNHLTSESSQQDGITKAVTSSITINKPLSNGDRTFRCKNCNEANHPTHLCSIDKHSISAIMLSIDRLPHENANRSNKWKVPAETIMSKQAALKCTNITNQSKELPVPSSGYSAKVVNKEFPPQCFKKTCFRDGRTNATSDFAFDKGEPALHPDEIHSIPEGRELNQFGDISREFEMKSSEQMCPSTEPCISNTLKASVIPKLEFFWQGSFEVPKKGRLPECCDGLQAHLSSSASGKVFEAAKEFPPHKLQLEEVHFLSCWPQQFHGNHAKEHNIALFFFAKDIKSYRNNYCKLLDNMLKYDLALKGKFRGFELLIFPSYKLSEKSQRWNRLYFLWGIFKEAGQVS